MASLTNAFYHGWELTLVMFAAMPILMVRNSKFIEVCFSYIEVHKTISTFCFSGNGLGSRRSHASKMPQEFTFLYVLQVATGIIAKSQTLLTEKEFAAYGRAGAIAEEALSAIRTVIAYGGQKKEVDRYKGY